AGKAGDRFEEREITEWLVVALVFGPAPVDEAARRCRELLEKGGGDVGSEVGILGGLSTLAAMQGRTGEVEKLITQAKQRMDELGEWVWLFSYHRADTALWQDDPVAAELELRPALNPLKKLGDKSRLSPLA